MFKAQIIVGIIAVLAGFAIIKLMYDIEQIKEPEVVQQIIIINSK